MGAVDRDGVADVQSVDALDFAERVSGIDAPADCCVASRRKVRLGLLRLGCVVAEDAGPLL